MKDYYSLFEQLRESHPEKLLLPEAVVEYAQSHPEHSIHKEFPWDDQEAAREYRLALARKLIRVSVVILPDQTEPISAYVSLTTDRSNPSGGYRSLVSVLTEPEQAQQMLADALAELERWRKKYGQLQELARVFEAVDALV